MMVLKKVTRLLTTPGMPAHWMRWHCRLLGLVPEVTLPGGARLRGFDTFSEYWGAKTLIPPAAEVRFIQQSVVGRDGAVIDVGANVGFFSLLLSGWTETGPIFAFEPAPTNYQKLCANIELNAKASRICPERVALSDRTEPISFLADERNPTRNRALIQPSRDLRGVTTVNATSLDQFAAAHHIEDIAFLKIDVEGYEPSVLRGAARVLTEKRCHAGLIELCPANLRQCQSSVQELLETVDEVGYELRYLTDDGSCGSLVTVENAVSVVLDNVALLPKAS
jgi:FkbM family methyltransferase